MLYIVYKMQRLFSVVQFKSKSGVSKLMKFRGKVLMGSSPGSAARKAITFICSQTTEKKGCSSMAVQLKEVKVSVKDGKKVFTNVGDKLYNYTGTWDHTKRSISFNNKTIEFKGAPVIKSCRPVAGKTRSPLCKLLNLK
jgi:hypothetical protein